MRRTLSVLALLAVAACSSSSSTGSAEQTLTDAGAVSPDAATGLSFAGFTDASGTDAAATTFATAVDDFIAASDIDGKDLDAFNASRFDTIPQPTETGAAAGTADYAGMLNINAGAEANLAAGIDVTVDFQSTSIVAEQTTGFYAVDGDALEAYNGTVTFSNGKVGARGIPNNARLDVAGTLTTDTNTVVVDGEMTGKFRGTPIVGITANTAVADRFGADDEQRMMITLNGEEVTNGSAGFSVVAE